MTGLVLELQKDALNPEIKVSNLLRKALVVSKKLDIVEIEEWLSKELNGYSLQDDIPKYRVLHGEVKVWNPVQGRHMPLNFPDNLMAEEFSKRTTNQSIGELDSLSESDSRKMSMSFHPDNEKLLMEMMYPTALQPTLIIDKTQIIGILEKVRNNILNWSLELEQKGILGEGMSFSDEEKKLAHQTTYHITNNIGSMHNSQIQQDSANATQSLNVATNSDDLKTFIEELKSSLDKLSLNQEQTAELKETIATLEIQANSTKPKETIIRESLHTVRNILEGTTGSIIATGLLYQLGLF